MASKKIEREENDHDAGGEEDDDLAERLAKRARHQHGRGGWQGADLELERPNPAGAAASSTVVDLEQFRNHQIGVGYQAKHVIRQPQTATTTATVKSSLSSKSLSLVEDNHERDKKKKDEGPSRQGGGGERGASSARNTSNEDNKSTMYNNKYLQHAGLRRLRKELEMYK
jgi:hypothetical protein